MARVQNWENRLLAVIAKHQKLPQDYSLSNCYIIPDDGVEAVLGERIHPVMYDGTPGPKTERGAASRLLKHGFRNVEEAFAARFEPRKSVLQAKRGDIGVINIDGIKIGGLFTAIGFMTRDQNGICFLPHSKVTIAFKVE